MIWLIVGLTIAVLLEWFRVLILERRVDKLERYLAREKETLKKVIRRLK